MILITQKSIVPRLPSTDDTSSFFYWFSSSTPLHLRQVSILLLLHPPSAQPLLQPNPQPHSKTTLSSSWWLCIITFTRLISYSVGEDVGWLILNEARRLSSWQRKKFGPKAKLVVAEEHIWWGKDCHVVPRGNIIVRENDWGCITAHTLRYSSWVGNLNFFFSHLSNSTPDHCSNLRLVVHHRDRSPALLLLLRQNIHLCRHPFSPYESVAPDYKLFTFVSRNQPTQTRKVLFGMSQNIIILLSPGRDSIVAMPPRVSEFYDKKTLPKAEFRLRWGVFRIPVLMPFLLKQSLTLLVPLKLLMGRSMDPLLWLLWID